MKYNTIILLISNIKHIWPKYFKIFIVVLIEINVKKRIYLFLKFQLQGTCKQIFLTCPKIIKAYCRPKNT